MVVTGDSPADGVTLLLLGWHVFTSLESPPFQIMGFAGSSSLWSRFPEVGLPAVESSCILGRDISLEDERGTIFRVPCLRSS